MSSNRNTFSRGLFLALLVTFSIPIHPIHRTTIALFIGSVVHAAIGAICFYNAYDTYAKVNTHLIKVPELVKKYSATFQDITQTNERCFYKLYTLGTVSCVIGLMSLYIAYALEPGQIDQKKVAAQSPEIDKE